jgi:hypothetical protein
MVRVLPSLALTVQIVQLRPGWTDGGITAGRLTWRDAPAAWPKPIATDRATVTEPESAGMTLTAANGNEAILIRWRGGLTSSWEASSHAYRWPQPGPLDRRGRGPAVARDQSAALLPVLERVLGDEHRHTLTARADLAYWTLRAENSRWTSESEAQER